MAGNGMRLSKFANPIRSAPFGSVLSSIEVVEHPADDTRWMNGLNLYTPATNIPIRRALDCGFTGTDVVVTTIAPETNIFEPFLMQTEVDCSMLSSMFALEELRVFTENEFNPIWETLAETHLFTGILNGNGGVDGNEGFSNVAVDVSVSGGTATADLIAFAEYQIAVNFGAAQCAIFIPVDEFAHVTHSAGLPFIDGKWFTPTGNLLIPFTSGVGTAGSAADSVWIAELPLVLHVSPTNVFVPETWIELNKNKFHIHVERVGMFEHRNVAFFDIA